MLGVYGAYVGPMLIHFRLLEAMLEAYSSHVELMSSQERRVLFENSGFEGVFALEIGCGRVSIPPRSGFSWVS